MQPVIDVLQNMPSLHQANFLTKFNDYSTKKKAYESAYGKYMDASDTAKGNLERKLAEIKSQYMVSEDDLLTFIKNEYEKQRLDELTTVLGHLVGNQLAIETRVINGHTQYFESIGDINIDDVAESNTANFFKLSLEVSIANEE